jgi:hypothetical protein
MKKSIIFIKNQFFQDLPIPAQLVSILRVLKVVSLFLSVITTLNVYVPSFAVTISDDNSAEFSSTVDNVIPDGNVSSIENVYGNYPPTPSIT